VPPPWIAETVDVLEYCPFRLSSGFPSVAPYQLCLERFEERLDQPTIMMVLYQVMIAAW